MVTNRKKLISKAGDRPSFTAKRKRVGKGSFEETTSRQNLNRRRLAQQKAIKAGATPEEVRNIQAEPPKPSQPKQKPKTPQKILPPQKGVLDQIKEKVKGLKPKEEKLNLVQGKLLGQRFQLPAGEPGQGLPPELALAATPGGFGSLGAGTAIGAKTALGTGTKTTKVATNFIVDEAGNAQSVKQLVGKIIPKNSKEVTNNFPKYEKTISKIAKMTKTDRKLVETKIRGEILDIESKKYAENVLGKKILGISPKKLALTITGIGAYATYKFIDYTNLIQWFALDNTIGQAERRVNDFRDDVQFRGLDPAEALRLSRIQRDNVEIARETVIEINALNPLAYKFRKLIMAGADASFDAMDRTILELAGLITPEQQINPQEEQVISGISNPNEQ